MIGPKGFLADLDRFPGKGFTAGKAAASVFQSSQIVVNGCDLRMIGSKCLFADCESPAIQPLRFRKAAHVLVKDRKVVEKRGQLRGGPRIDSCCQSECTTKTRLCFFVVTQFAINFRELR